MATARKPVKKVRRKTFRIREKEILEAHYMLDQAIKYLSAELYADDTHFHMEFIQVSMLFFFVFTNKYI